MALLAEEDTMTPEREQEIRVWISTDLRVGDRHTESVMADELLAALDAERAEVARLTEALGDARVDGTNKATRLVDEERRRWYAALAWHCNYEDECFEGYPPEGVSDRLHAKRDDLAAQLAEAQREIKRLARQVGTLRTDLYNSD